MKTVQRHLATLSIGFLAVAVLLAWIPGQAVAQEVTEPGDAATIEVAEDEELGAYLTDEEGMSLYLFEQDNEEESACYGECARAWPPVTTDAEPEAGEGVHADMLGTIAREDGSTQVTYNGWPLYYYVPDHNPGDIEGHDVDEYGAEWYLISPEGEKVEAEVSEE